MVPEGRGKVPGRPGGRGTPPPARVSQFGSKKTSFQVSFCLPALAAGRHCCATRDQNGEGLGARGIPGDETLPPPVSRTSRHLPPAPWNHQDASGIELQDPLCPTGLLEKKNVSLSHQKKRVYIFQRKSLNECTQNDIFPIPTVLF